jgi:Flp pilus assembly protein TadD
MNGSQGPGKPTIAGWKRGVLPVAALVVATVLVYANSLSGAFVFDDIDSIVQNKSLQSLATAFSPPPVSTVCGRPVLNATLALNAALGGTAAAGYHAVNILIHVLAGLVLYSLLRRTLRGDAIPPHFRDAATGLAFTVALLWCLHPLQTGAVTYVVQRAESLMSLFLLLTLYCVARGAAAARPAGWYAAAVAACALGMGTKEAMVTAPVLVLLYDRIFLAGSWSAVLARRRVVYGALAATWVLLGLAMASCPGRGGTVGFSVSISPIAYAMTQFGVIVHYLRLVFWPVPLVIDYGWPIARAPGAILPAALAVLALAGLTVWGLRRAPRYAFLGAAFFLLLSPTSSFVPVQDPIFEHRMYLPLACVLAAVVFAVHAGLSGASAGPRRLMGLAAAIAAVAFGAATVDRNRDYHSGVGLWRDTIAKRPLNARAHDELGIALARGQDLPGAVAEHTEAIRLRPQWALPYYNRGVSLLSSGRYEEAIQDFTASLRLRRDADAFNNRAVCYFALGDFDRAWTDLDSMQALGMTPNPAFVQRLRAASGRAP